MGILLYLIIFILFIGLIVLVVVFSFLRNIFRFGRKKTMPQDEFQKANRKPKKEKFFREGEGEYVDYEEIK